MTRALDSRTSSHLLSAKSRFPKSALGPKSFALQSSPVLQPVAEGNVGLAFGLVIAAGLSTTIGSTFVFCSSYANTKALAAALGVSAGVMLYVSFVEIFAIKAVQGFTAAHGEKYGGVYATLAFFGGIAATTGLDALVHAIGRYQRDRGVDKTKTFSQNETGTDEGDSPAFASLDSGANKNTENASVLGGCACAWASEGGFEDMKNLKKLRTSSHKKTSGKGKSPKHGTDPADMLAGERYVLGLSPNPGLPVLPIVRPYK